MNLNWTEALFLDVNMKYDHRGFGERLLVHLSIIIILYHIAFYVLTLQSFDHKLSIYLTLWENIEKKTFFSFVLFLF